VAHVNLNTIGEDLLKLCDSELHEDFIAICVQVDAQGHAKHNGIVICYDEKLYYFHFNGNVHYEELDIDNLPNDLYINKIRIFGDGIVLSFMAYCEILKDEVSPEYGFVFQDSFYNGDGTYYSESNLPDITTCVGFCINVIRGFLYKNKKYIEIDDWDNSTIDSLPYDFQYLLDSIKIQLEQIANATDQTILQSIKDNNFKRIKPSELTCSAFFEDLPIRKTSIDFVNPTLETTLQLKHLI
jgi:hypothetical protein